MQFTHKTTLPYPRLLLLGSMYVLAAFLYAQGAFDVFTEIVTHGGYATVLVAGVLFSFGLTTPFATAIFLSLSGTVHAPTAAIAAGIAASLGDVALLRFIRFSLHEELSGLRRVILWISEHRWIPHHTVIQKVTYYLKWLSVGLMMASPIPDEIPLSMLGAHEEPNERTLGIVSFCAKSIGIYALLSIPAII